MPPPVSGLGVSSKPKRRSDSYGGDLIGSGSLQLSWPMLRFNDNCLIQGNVFGNFGRLFTLREEDDVKGNLIPITEESKVSLGTGLVLNFGRFKFTISLSHPLTQNSDSQKRLHYGLFISL